MENKALSSSSVYLPELKFDLPLKLPENPEKIVYNISISVNDFTNFSKISSSQTLMEPVKLFNDTEKNKSIKNSPSFSEVKKGAVIQKGHQGGSVVELQTRLNKLGFGIKPTGQFGPTTENILKQFQKKYGVEPTGKFGKSTLSALESAEKSFALGKKLAVEAKNVATERDTLHHCYNAVAESIDKIFGRFLTGESAYMSANQFASNLKFKEIHMRNTELTKLPAGAIVVWGKTSASPHGHISVCLGDGREASDHIEEQRSDLRGYTNFRVFLPVKD